VIDSLVDHSHHLSILSHGHIVLNLNHPGMAGA